MVFVIVANDFDESLLCYKFATGYHYYREGTSGELELRRIDYTPAVVNAIARKPALVRYVVINLEFDYAALLNRTARFAHMTEDVAPTYVGNTSAASDAMRLQKSKKAIDTFLAQLAQVSGLTEDSIVFAVDGIRPQHYDAAALAKTGDTFFAIMREYFIVRARERGYRVLDLQPLFIAQHETSGKRFEFEKDSHWSAPGHRVVAEAIAGSEPYRTLMAKP